MSQSLNDSLIEFAEREFHELLSGNRRKDAIKVLQLVVIAANGGPIIEKARNALGWMEYDLGVNPAMPDCPTLDDLPPDEFIPGTLSTTHDEDLELEIDSELLAA